MRLHFTQVRRARGLAMPLPPTPKPPLQPPVLFGFRGVSIQTRAGVVEAFGSWEEFLDEIADHYVDSFNSMSFPKDLLSLVERLVPPAELPEHRQSMRARCEARREAERAASEAFRAEVAEKGVGSMILDRLFGRAA